jgi:hypothetical protein
MSGWTLVETLKRPAFGRYFPAGTEIYERTYTAGSKVTIPAMRGTSTSYANLIFVKTLVVPMLAIGIEDRHDGDRDDKGWETRDYHRPWEWSDDHDFMNLIGGERKAWGEDQDHRPHVPTFAPLSTLSFGADIGREERDSLQQAWRSAWTIDWGSGETAIEPRNYKLPYASTNLTGKAKLYLSMPDGYPVATTTIDLGVENRAKLDLQQPEPDSKLRAGDRQRLDYRALDMAGRPLPDGAVSWQWSLDGSTWTALTLDREGRFLVPTTVGAYYLKAQWDEGEGHPHEAKAGYTIVKSGKR